MSNCIPRVAEPIILQLCSPELLRLLLPNPCKDRLLVVNLCGHPQKRELSTSIQRTLQAALS